MNACPIRASTMEHALNRDQIIPNFARLQQGRVQESACVMAPSVPGSVCSLVRVEH